MWPKLGFNKVRRLRLLNNFATVRVVVNTRLLLKNKLEGIGWFTYETLKRITEQRPNDEFIFVFDRPYHPDFVFTDNVVPFQIGPPSRHPLLWMWWFGLSIPKVLNHFKPDVFVSPDGYLTLNTFVPQLSVMHDINFEHTPEQLPWAYQKYYRHYFQKFAQKATRIATVSEFSKQDIQNVYKVDENKIDVVYNGFNTLYTNDNNQNYAPKSTPYFLFIGSLNPRKNLERMLLAFDQFKKETGMSHQFKVVGEKMWRGTSIEITVSQMQFKDDVLFLGRVAPDDLKLILSNAFALSFCSLFEGFGIPILEGFASGIPVITSNVSSMPEVAGDAALLVDPTSVDSIKNHYVELAKNATLRQNLIDKGLTRSKDFSWNKTAALLWESIEKTANV